MRRVISLSALVSGLLASPGLAAPGSVMRRDGEADHGAIVAAEQAVETQAQLQERLADMVERGPEDIGGMQELQRQIGAEMQAHLERALAAAGQEPVVQLADNLEGQQGDFPGWESLRLPPVLPEAEAGSGLAGVAFDILPAQRMEKGTFLGVTTSRVTPTLGEQLKLPQGMGLVVDFVAKDSPALAAGLQQHDVLEKLNDQWLVNREQLAVLVRSKKPGDEVTLRVIRGGSPLEIKATLVERDVPVLELEDPEAPRFILPGPVAPPGAGADGRSGLWQPGQRIRVVRQADGSMSGTLEDEKGRIELTRQKDGSETLVAKDPEGKEVFSGPFSTEADRARAPADIRARALRIEFDGQHPGAEGTAVTIQPDGTVRLEAGGGKTLLQGTSLTLRRTDEKYQITMTIDKDGRSVLVKDAKTGRVIYEGSAETEEDFKKMPADVAEMVRGLEHKVEAGR